MCVHVRVCVRVHETFFFFYKFVSVQLQDPKSVCASVCMSVFFFRPLVVMRVSDHLQQFEDFVTVKEMHIHKTGLNLYLTVEGTWWGGGGESPSVS